MATIDEALSKRLDDETKQLIGKEQSNVKIWINTRRGHRQSVTKTAKAISSKTITDLVEAQSLKDKCLNLQKELETLDSSICNEMIVNDKWSDDKCDAQNANCETYRDSLRSALCRINLVIDGLSASTNSSVSPKADSFNPKMNLPKLELPSFDDRPENYARFITQFEAIMGKFNLTSFEKFSYLEQQLSGSARELLNAVPLDDMRYETAKKLLDKAFLSDDIQKFAVLDRLVNLRMKGDDAFKWISDINMLKHQIDKLKIDVNFFLQYFAWQGLTDAFKQQLINITNESRPSLDLIIDKSFEANTRLKQLGQSRYSNSIEPRAVALATTLEKAVKDDNMRSSKCSLCNKGNHFANFCPDYTSSFSKIERAKSLGLCLRCAKRKHKGYCINLKRKCLKCNAWHFDFMCNADDKSKSMGKGKKEKASNKSKGKETPIPPVESAASSVVFPIKDHIEKDILVPTFTAKLKGSNKCADVRSIYDVWSQTTFILDSLASKLQCKVLSEVDLSVHGFNSRKTSKAKLVEVSIFTDKEYKIKAVTVPSFHLSVKIPALDKVVETFLDKGYTMADKNLTGTEIGDIEFLLGSNNIGVLPVTSKILRVGNAIVPISWLDSTLGVMLQGSASRFVDCADCINDANPDNTL